MKIYKKQIKIGDFRFCITVEIDRVIECIEGNHVVEVEGIENFYYLSYSAFSDTLEDTINQSIKDVTKWEREREREREMESQNEKPEIVFLKSIGFDEILE